MRDRSYVVYLHINKINGKTYVGITKYVDNPNRRWRNGNGYRMDSIIYKAINKYGWNNFNHIIFCKTSKEIACLLERDLIKFYKGRKISYNIGLGGEGSKSFSEETKEKLRSYVPYIKGRHHTEEAKKKISEAGKRPCSEETKRKIGVANSGVNNGMYGKSISDYARRLIIEKFSKPVLQLDLNNNIINRFSSASEAERHLGGKGNHVGCCCLGKRKTAYGYKWRYE